jgi:L-threonylcarbamoyladenylate synthase
LARTIRTQKAARARTEAIRVLEGGGVVAIPTETVYGLAADATNGEAVARIFEVKGRPRFNPLIVHVSDQAMAERIALFSEAARFLAFGYWPGPLTMVLPLRADSGIHPLVTAGLDTVAIRMPRGFARDLIAQFGRPLAAPSANSSGRLSPTTAEAVRRDLGRRIPLIIDGGPSPVGVESTIIAMTPQGPLLLRPGGIDLGQLGVLLRVPVLRAGQDAPVSAPGMLKSHYAPRAALRLDARSVRPTEALLAFGPRRIRGARAAAALLNLSEKADLREAARNLFSHLGTLDRSGVDVIAVEPIPEEGLGEAINDRLRRAAAPRTMPAEAVAAR